MGVSSDGILVFGIELGLEDELPEFLYTEDGDEIDFDEMVDGELGTHDLPYSERVKARKAYPVDLVCHCSYDYPMYILAVPGTEISASRGYPHEFTNGLPTVTQEQIDAFKEWAAEHDIEGEPCWVLTSMYG